MHLDVNIARIADFVDTHILNAEPLKDGVPPFSSIEFSNNASCNRRCLFCPRVDAGLFPNKDEHLSLDLFKKVMEELSGLNYSGRISFSGFCEPLLTNKLEEYIAFGKRACPKMTIEISSNGDMLSEERLKSLFAAGLDNIRVSLYDGSHQDKNFIEMKNRCNLTDKQFILRKRYLSPQEHFGLTISNRAGALILKNYGLSITPLAEPLKQPCYYPFYKMLADHNGDVLICSNDWLKKMVVGNLNDSTVFEIWSGEKFNMTRRNLIDNNRAFSPCNVCDVNGLYNGDKHFAAWVSFYKKR